MKAHVRFLILCFAILGVAMSSRAQLSGTLTVPSATYPTLKAVIDSLNLRGLGAGGAIVNFTPATNEIAPVNGYRLGSSTLNASLSAAKPLTINGNGNTLTAYAGTSTTADGIFYIMGADYVTINNLNLAEAAANTTTTTQMEWGYSLVKLSGTAPFDGCQNDVINGCSISLNKTYINTIGIRAAHTIAATTTLLTVTGATVASTNSNNIFTGNTITNVTRGISLVGINNGAAFYDKDNKIGGATLASGNNITIGGSTNASFGVFTERDSVMTIRNNTFVVAAGQNAAFTHCVPSFGVGDLTVTGNTFNMNCAMATAAAIAFSNVNTHTDPGVSTGTGSTQVISGNTIFGNNTAATSAAFTGITISSTFCRSLTVSNNTVSNINWNTSTGAVLCFNIINGGIPFLTINNNVVYNVAKTGTSGTLSGYVIRNQNALFGPMTVKDNIIRKAKNNSSIAAFQIFGQTAASIAGLPSGIMLSNHNVVDSIDVTGATSATITNNMGMNGQDGSVVSYDSVMNIQLPATGTGSMTTTLGDGINAPNVYVSKKNYIGNISGGTGNNNVVNNLGLRTSLCDSNVVENITLVGTGQCNTNLGIFTNGIVSNNRFNNITLTNADMNWYLVNNGENPTFRYNAFTNLNINGSGSYRSFGPGFSSIHCAAYNNRWDNIKVTTGVIQPLVMDLAGGTFSIHDNVMSNISVVSNTTAAIDYYHFQGVSGTVNFYNNSLTNISLPPAYNTTSSNGLYLSPGMTYHVYNNTFRINPAVAGGGTYGFTGIAYDAGALLDLRNNIINVNVTPTGGFTTAVRRLTGAAGISPVNFLNNSNGNIYYAPNTLNSWLYGEGNNAPGMVNTYNLSNDPGFNTPCGLFKNFIGHDQASYTENNLVPGPLPGTYIPAGTSFAKNGSVPTTAPQVVYDLAGTQRPAFYDMGALQFVGTGIDNAPPVISYTPVPTGSYCTLPPRLIATITDVAGVNNTPNTAPRLYYKKSTENNAFGAGNTSVTNGWKYVEATSITGNDYAFDFDYTILTGPVIAGDSITYFIIAQDLSSAKNTGANIVGFPICPLTVALGSANGPINNAPVPNGFRMLNTPVFSVDAFLPSACLSGSGVITLAPDPVGAGIQWQSATLTGAFANIPGATSISVNTGTLTATTRYRAVIYCGASILTTSQIDTFIVGNPAILSTTGATRCGYGSVTLGVTTPPFTLANWYTASSGGTPFFSGNTYVTPNISSSKTYYVSANTPKAGNEIVGVTSPVPTGQDIGNQWGIEILFSKPSTNFYTTTVYPTGTGTITVDLIDASGATTWPTKGPFTVSGSGLGSPNVLVLNWKNIPPGDYFLQLGTAITGTVHLNYELPVGFPYLSPSGNARIVGGCNAGAVNGWDPYYFFFYNNVISSDCETSTRVPITATITPPPPITVSSLNSPGICLGSSATLNVTSLNASYNYSWAPGGAITQSVVVSPTATTTYFLTATDPYTGCVGFDSILMAVNAVPAPPVITPKNPSICGGSSALLNGSTPPGASAQTTIGTGTLTNSTTTYPTPYGQWYGSNHDQYIILASELLAAGIKPNSNINSLAFYVNAGYTGAPLPKFTIQLGNTNQAAASLTLLCAPALVTVYGPITVNLPVSGSGWQTYNFTVPFFYTGGNLAVDVSSSNCSVCNNTTSCSTSFTSNGTVNQSATPFTSTVSYWADNNCTVTSCLPSGTSSMTSNQRPNMQFNYQPPAALNWLVVTGLYKNAALTTPVALTDTTVNVYASPAVTTVYRAVTNTQGCISAPSLPDTVFVTPSPLVTITPAGPQTICSGQPVSLCIPTGANQTYQWFLNNVAIAGALSNCYVAGAAGSYTVTATNIVTGCSATSIPTVLTVNALPAVTATAGGPTTICSGSSVVLTANSATALAWQWKESGTAIAGATGASYTATGSGNYTVEVTNASGCKQTSNIVAVTVNTTPGVVTPLGPTSFCTGGSVVLQAPTSATLPLTYQWYNGGGAIPGAAASAYTATTTGNYYVIVTNTGTGCTTTSAPTQVTVGTGPSSVVNPQGAVNGCQGSTVTLSAVSQPGLCYQWNLNGTPIAGATSATYGATTNGSYTVMVSICATPGCNSSSAIPTVVTLNPLPAASVSPATITPFCQGGSALLTASGTTSTVSYQWNLNGTPVSGASSGTINAVANGNYTVTVTDVTTGCANVSNAVAVTVYPLPVIGVTTATPTTFCQGGSVALSASTGFSTYTWKRNGVTVSTGSASSFTATSSGLYSVTVNSTNGCPGTSATTSVQVNALPNVTTIPTGATSVCQGLTKTFAVPADTALTYQWYNGATAITGATQNTYATGTSGTYTVKVINTVTGCLATSAPIVLTVTTPPAATATAVAATTFCQDDSVRLNASSGSGLTYQWRFNGNDITGATGDFYYAKVAGRYTVAISNPTGCTTLSNSILITVNPRPASYITYSTPLEFCEGGAVVLTANAGTGLTYQWLMNGTPTGNTSGINISAVSGMYSLKATNIYGCSTLSLPLNVTVYPAPIPIIMRTGPVLQTTQPYAAYQWFFDNAAIGGATSDSYNFTGNGAYKVRVVDVNGCEGYSSQFFVNNVGVTTTAAGKAIQVYPNPTNGIVHIDAAVKIKVVLRDVTGKTVIEGVDVKEIDLRDIANGTYLLYISDLNNQLLRAEKVTKTDN